MIKNIIKIKENNQGLSITLTMILLSIMLVIAIGATDILNKSLRSSNISGRSTVAYLAAESGAEKMLWFAVNDVSFESNFAACSTGGYIDIHDSTSFKCAEYDHLIDLTNPDYYYKARYTRSGIYHVYETIGNYFGSRRNIEMKYVK